MHNANHHPQSDSHHKERLNSVAMLVYAVSICIAVVIIVSSFCGAVITIPSFIFENLRDDRRVLFFSGFILGVGICITYAVVIRSFIKDLCDDD